MSKRVTLIYTGKPAETIYTPQNEWKFTLDDLSPKETRVRPIESIELNGKICFYSKEDDVISEDRVKCVLLGIDK
ncbi:hypothetical protein [Escherichia coli]|uniref:hypothetical protein n=1 Tax=Escherichia coli TaxID=562 RepID=UPI000BDEC00D|nr:hypothetical protein [Escherichia coli]EFK0298319.1 hypothetical protein [Escherichia coli]EFK4024432.1 hypothetical protein [Escherichia coli]EHC9165323.1 hypothetical protein [Escherichia coli]EHY5565731.1 hypothetical protein [Escherichia coli]EIC4226500.1 hypothetical protein [Escherichia coli]